MMVILQKKFHRLDVPAAQEIPVSVEKGKIEKKRLDAASYKAASNPSP